MRILNFTVIIVIGFDSNMVVILRTPKLLSLIDLKTELHEHNYETIPVKFQLSSFLFLTPHLCSAVCFNKMVLKAWPHFEIDWDYKPLTSD